MMLFIVSFIVFVIAMFAMAVGIIFANKSFSGGCGSELVNGTKSCRCTKPCKKKQKITNKGRED
jgi:hypothetical protein